MQIDSLTLRPDASKATGWSALSVVVIGLGIWLVRDANGEPTSGPAMWVLLGLMIAVGAWFVLQLVVPTWFEVHVEPDGIRARTAWQHLDVPWDRIESASIRTFAGEPYLRLMVIEEFGDGWVVNPTAILLPLGADTAALRMALARARAVGRVGVDGLSGAA